MSVIRGLTRAAGLVLAAVFATATMAAAAEGPIFRFTGEPGPYKVGLKVVEQHDASRTFRTMTLEGGKAVASFTARPLQTLIWYPAGAAPGKPMTVADYAALGDHETSFEHSAPSSGIKEWRAAMTPAMPGGLWAVRDAPAAAGRFPVVIYAPSFSAPSWENADLCEYWASHGYVVVASTNLGATTREQTSTVAGIDAQARDISYLIGYAATLQDADTSKLAVAGFSWGGISNLFAAARDPRIKALVALDGSMRYFPNLVVQAGDVHPDQMTIPLIYFSQGDWTIEDLVHIGPPTQLTSPNVLNAWTHGDLTLVRMHGMIHVEYSSMYQRREDVWAGYAKQRKEDFEREDGITGYAWMARYTEAFLDGYLKGDPAGLGFLKKTAKENGVPPHFITPSFRAAKGAPVSFASLREQVSREGFDHAEMIYAAMLKQTPDFKVEEVDVADWADTLLAIGRPLDAVAVIKLGIRMHPDSGDAYAFLGDAYRAAGDKASAATAYKTAIEKDPEGSDDVKRKLAELTAHQP